jgi:hypothetical protein
MPAALILAGRAAGGLIVGIAVVAVIRWISSRSRLIGLLVAAGVLGRAWCGLALFWISYSNSAFVRALHTGDGFWILAIDAKAYYAAAILGAERGVTSILSGSASPAYVRVLALWLQFVGTSPAAALYLNIVLFVLAAALLVLVSNVSSERRAPIAFALGIAAFSFSPSLVIHSTQSLKDAFFASVTVVACAAAFVVLRALQRGKWRAPHRSSIVLATVALTAAVYEASGVRFYYGFLLVGSLALSATIAVAASRRQSIGRGCAAIGLIGLLLSALDVGAGPYFGGAVHKILGAGSDMNPATLLRRFADATNGAQADFANAPGGTNASDPGVTSSEDVRGSKTGSGRRWSLGQGAALMFLPLCVAQPLGLLHVSGGRSLLFMSDTDTIFLDSTVLLLGALLFASRASLRPNLPFVVFALSLSICSAILIAYIVSNLGALIRLRLMSAVPLWTAAIAIGPASRMRQSADVRGRERTAIDTPVP